MMDQSLLQVLSELQQLYASVECGPLQLPQLVLCGTQSCGKTSLVENICGREFLPRGTGIVTRRPLVLTLVCCDGPAWAQFLHTGAQRFDDFACVRDEIQRETSRLLDDTTTVAKGKAVSDEPIYLTIHAPNVIDISIVDLPGLTKVPVHGQPLDIEEQIRSMVLRYITPPTSIIIAVSPGNADLANSDSLKLAREVDPQGLRTLGVVTKLDLLDRGTDASEVLENRIVPLHHGHVGVVCRGEADSKNGLGITEALRNEVEFFRAHPMYRKMQQEQRIGTTFLARRLHTLLVAHARRLLPNLRAKLESTEASERQRWRLLHGGKDSEPFVDLSQEDVDVRLGVILKHINGFVSQMVDLLEGRAEWLHNLEDSSDVSSSGLRRDIQGGARIARVFRESFLMQLERLHSLDTVSDAAIELCLKNTAGLQPALFLPEACFELLVRQQMERLLSPCLACLDAVADEITVLLNQTVQHSRLGVARIYPTLAEELVRVAKDMAATNHKAAQEHVRQLLACELAYLNTQHDDFVGVERALQQLNVACANTTTSAGIAVTAQNKRTNTNSVPVLALSPQTWQQARQQQMTDKVLSGTSQSVALVRLLVSSYFSIVKKNMADQVPKAAMHFFVQRLKSQLQPALVQRMYQDQASRTLLETSPELARERQQCAQLLETLASSRALLDSLSQQ